MTASSSSSASGASSHSSESSCELSSYALCYWEKLFSSRNWGAYPPEELIRFVARHFGALADRSQVRVLEVGCGPGPNVWYLAREGYQVAGIDGSATAIRRARERLVEEGLSSASETFDLRVGNFVNLPWPDGAFDAVVDVAALYANTVADIRQTIGEIHRTLKPDGLFFGKMFGVETTGSDSGELVEPGTRRGLTHGPCAGNEIAHFFSYQELQALFRDFSSVAIDSMLRTEHKGETRIFHWLVTVRK